jgi:Fanconi-associated nuclease 1
LVGVEAHALRHYEETGGWRGLHCEGGPVLALFGLLMWDVLFRNRPDVFMTQFQDGCERV